LVKGDREALNGLQKDLAEDYVMNLDLKSSLDEKNNLSI
jgi:hypothetical protein